MRGLSTKNIYIQKTHLPFIPVHPSYPIEAKLSAFDTQKVSLFCTFVVHFVVYHEYIACIGIYLGQSRVSHLLQSRDQVTSLCTFICALSDYHFWKRGCMTHFPLNLKRNVLIGRPLIKAQKDRILNPLHRRWWIGVCGVTSPTVNRHGISLLTVQ